MTQTRLDDARQSRALNVYRELVTPIQLHGDTRRLQRMVRAVERMSDWGRLVIAAELIILVGVVDWLTGPELSFSIFYVLPVAMLGWHSRQRAADIAALVCGLVWLVAEAFSGKVYSYPPILYWNALVRTGLFLIVGHTLSQLRIAVEEEQRAGRTDSLTDIANNRSFMEACAYEIARQRRYHHPISVAFLDCDDFKAVNDRYGHAIGDEVLRRIAHTLRTSLRDVDVVARLGGDEFAVLLPESDVTAATVVCEKLRNHMMSAIAEYGVTFSVGLITFYSVPETAEQLLRAADLAMYEAKKEGKNATRHRVVGAEAVGPGDVL